MEGRDDGVEKGGQGGDQGGIREQGERLREEGVKRELREREERWLEEKRELERRIRELESGYRRVRGETEGGKQIEGDTEMRVRELEWKIEMKEREDRGRNVVMKEIKVREGKSKEAVEEILNYIGVKGG